MIRLAVLLIFFIAALAQRQCKTTPLDANWPSTSDWVALNSSINGALLKVQPVASSCYPENPFNSSDSCDEVEANWNYSSFHASLPESIDSPIYANNSCLPPNATGYTTTKGCSISSLPQYIVNATTEQQIATAMRWASERSIRIVVKGTGHDLNGRSSGAYSMSIWTRNFNSITLNSTWSVPGSNTTESVLIAGSGNNYGFVVRAALGVGRVVISGNDQTVGLGGHIQGGGHGPLSSTYGLAADQILQVRVVTTQGDILVADATRNQDLLWAIRGGGAGQYGVVTEYTLKTHPAPTNVVTANIIMSRVGNDSASINATWNALAVLASAIPDLMDAGLAGSANVLAGPSTGVSISLGFFAYNSTADALKSLTATVLASMQAQSAYKGSITVSLTDPVTYPSFLSFFDDLNSSPSGAGQASLLSSRLLGRAQLSDLTIPNLVSNFQRIMLGDDTGSESLLIIGLQAGPGPRSVEQSMRGALNPVWRSTYIHVISVRSNLNASNPPQEALNAAAMWCDQNLESVWREWAPDTGAYMNEANPFNSQFQHDFYGSSYDQLLEVKRKYDPTESLFVLSGVGSDAWEYDLNSGKLCRKN
ncbi:FAD-dependent monooxygenase [Trichoderma evansii]